MTYLQDFGKLVLAVEKDGVFFEWGTLSDRAQSALTTKTWTKSIDEAGSYRLIVSGNYWFPSQYKIEVKKNTAAIIVKEFEETMVTSYPSKNFVGNFV